MAMPAFIDGACAWIGRDIVGSKRWIRDLRPPDIAVLDGALAAIERRGTAWSEITRADFPLRELDRLFDDIRQELESVTSVEWVQDGIHLHIQGPYDRLTPETALQLANVLSTTKPGP